MYVISFEVHHVFHVDDVVVVVVLFGLRHCVIRDCFPVTIWCERMCCSCLVSAVLSVLS